MLATLGELPGPPGWGYEFKWDGVRAVTYLDGGQVRVVTRNDRDVVDSYPELRRLLGRFPRRRLVLDGEIVALDPTGAPSFSLLQQRMHVRTPSPALRERYPSSCTLSVRIKHGPFSLKLAMFEPVLIEVVRVAGGRRGSGLEVRQLTA